MVRLRDIKTAAAFRVQRLFRGWVGRQVCERLLVAKFKAGLLAAHLKRRRKDKDHKVVDMPRGRLHSLGSHGDCALGITLGADCNGVCAHVRPLARCSHPGPGGILSIC